MTRPRSIHFSLVVLLSFLIAHATPACAIEFLPLGDLPGGYPGSKAFGISPDGTIVVGESNGLPTGADYDFEAFLWTRSGGMIGLGDLPGYRVQGTANDVSNNGVVVGQGTTSDSQGARKISGFAWSASTGMIDLGDLPGTFENSVGNGVSGDGLKVTGSSDGFGGYQSFLWTYANGIQPLAKLPGDYWHTEGMAISTDGTTVVGVSLLTKQAMRWVNGAPQGIGQLYADQMTYAEGVSPNGSVVVGYGIRPDGKKEAGVWTLAAGQWTPLGDFDGGDFHSEAWDVSGNAIAVGIGTNAAGTLPFVWHEGQGMLSLQSVLTAQHAMPAGWLLREATGISDNGRFITGWGVNPNGRDEAFLVELGPSILPGDLDYDADVDARDLALLVGNFGMPSGATWWDGDINGDGAVNLADVIVLQSHFGQSLSAASSPAAIPEPSSAVLLVVAMAMACGYAQRRRRANEAARRCVAWVFEL